MNKLPPMFATVRHAARWVAIAVASVVAMPAAAQSPELTTASDVAPDLGAQLRQQVFAMDRAYRSVHDYTATFYKQERVNGELLPLSAPIKADKAGRPLPRYQSNSYTLGNSEVLLMSDVSATSFDGRYFGPINRSQIKTVIRPVITW